MCNIAGLHALGCMQQPRPSQILLYNSWRIHMRRTGFSVQVTNAAIQRSAAPSPLATSATLTLVRFFVLTLECLCA